MNDPLDLGSIDFNMGAAPKKRTPKKPGKSYPKSEARKAREQGKQDKSNVQNKMNTMNKTANTEGSGGESLVPESGRQFKSLGDVLDRLSALASGDHPTAAISALKELAKIMAAETSITDRIDPAQVCAYLARAQLHGLNPADVLIQQHGITQLAQAIGKSLGLDGVRLDLGDKTGEYRKQTQCLQGDATE